MAAVETPTGAHGIPTVYLPATPEEFARFVENCDGSGPEWHLVHSDSACQVWERKSQSSNVNIVRMRCKITIDALTLYDVLHDPDYRKEWDDNMVEGYMIEQLDATNDVGYYSAKSPVMMVSARDWCNERCWQVNADQTQYIIMNHSVIHPKCPEKKGFVRANSLMSGYLIRVDPAGGCTLTYLTQSDLRGWIPSSVMNFVTTRFAPKIVGRLEKAAGNYAAWKAKNNPGHYPWRGLVVAPAAAST